jgi:hypothetical protein
MSAATCNYRMVEFKIQKERTAQIPDLIGAYVLTLRLYR